MARSVQFLARPLLRACMEPQRKRASTMTRRADDRREWAVSSTPKRAASPVRHRLTETEVRRLKHDFATIGLPVGPAHVHEDALNNVCLAVFRLGGRLVCSHWRDDLTEIDDPTLRDTLDVVALHDDADQRGLPQGTAARDAFLVYGIALALNAALKTRGQNSTVTVERFDDGTAPTRRDYLEGALFTAADRAAGRRPMRLILTGAGMFMLEEI